VYDDMGCERLIDLSTLKHNGNLNDDGWIHFDIPNPCIVIPVSGIITRIEISDVKEIFSISKIIKKYTEELRCYSLLYFDKGDGFNSADVIKFDNTIGTGDFYSEFNIPCEKINALRFDPFEDRFGNIRNICILCIDSSGEEYVFDSTKLRHNGVVSAEGWITFNTFDPQIFIPVQGNISKVIVTGYIQFFNGKDVLNTFVEKERELLKKNRELLKKNRELLKKNREISHLRNSYPYRIGSALLWPLKFVYRIMKMIRNMFVKSAV